MTTSVQNWHTCVGCGLTFWAGETQRLCLETLNVAACKACWAKFSEIFLFPGGVPREGIALPESPASRIADALLRQQQGR